MNRIAAWFRRVWQVVARWFTDLAIISDPIERKQRADKKAREKAIATERARLQARLDSGRYELIAVWRKVKRRRRRVAVAKSAFPAQRRRPPNTMLRRGWRWYWRRAGDAMRAVNPRRRRAKRILAEHGVNYNSGRQRRNFRKTFNRAYRATQLPPIPVPIVVDKAGHVRDTGTGMTVLVPAAA